MTDKIIVQRMTNFRWVICGMLFLATTINYMDRQVLSLTWKDFIAPEFHWTDTDYGNVAGIFALVYAIANLVSGRFIDRLGTKKGYLVAIGVWSAGACLHALCGWATETVVGLDGAAQMVGAAGATASTIAMVSVYFFMAARIVLAAGEAGNFPAAVKVTAEYFPKKRQGFRNGNIQLRHHGGRAGGSPVRAVAGKVLQGPRRGQRLGNGVPYNRRTGIPVDGYMAFCL